MIEKTTDVTFKSKFYDMILNGEKVQTTRLPLKRWNVEKGDIVTAYFVSEDNVVGQTLKLKIVKVGYKAFRNLDEADAFREGYSSLCDLKMDLKEIYPNMLYDFSRVYYYQFVVVGVRVV